MNKSNTEFLLERELNEVLNNTEKGFHNYKSEIKIKAGEEWFIPIRIDHMLLVRGYGDDSLGDFRVVECLMLLGDVTHKILPFRDNISIELVNTPLTASGNGIDLTGKIVSKRFRGIINTSAIPDISLTNKSSVDPSQANLNHGNLIPVQFQLIDETVYQLLMLSCGTTFRDVSPTEVLLSTYSKYIKQLGIKENERIDSFSVREGYNQTKRRQISIPDGTMVKDIHRILQNEEGGIYPTGLGRYIQNNTLYVYPLYDFKSHTKNIKVLNIISIADGKFKGSEITFKDEETKLTILATGNITTTDEGLVNNLESGNAVRFGNANTLLSGSFEQDNKSLVDKASNTFEVGLNKLKTGLNNVRTTKVTSNPYREYSELARKQGKQINIEWFRGSAELLTPGMPVKFINSNGNRIETSTGVLLGVSENRIPTQAGVITNNFSSIVTLNIFVDRNIEIEETTEA